ncbi:hypothetical protein IMZ11_02135 [Microtetraspora sp. AC03309]|uniref:hypothetical protein n=1 Tax=Microtetraspora sp. AC03309 TaxID=2779376 RepID=UPI001E46B2EE|nr:hypothetical protein [Microtetraspora sp. AC03309]MCC5574439.1 hypothetical protein [Microtetraspora sp. AC03309]
MTASTTLRVPYITAWSDEAVPQNLAFRYHVEAGGLRLTYTDPHDSDWVYGVLRARQGLSQRGRPEWRLVNTLRQWRCMEHSLCQVCGQTAVDERERIWWVLTDTDGTSMGDGYTNAPPTCCACIPEAIASCPRLRTSAAVYTAGGSAPFAVLAHEFAFGTGGAVLVERNVLIDLDEFRRLNGALAQQLVVTLSDLRREDL